MRADRIMAAGVLIGWVGAAAATTGVPHTDVQLYLDADGSTVKTGAVELDASLNELSLTENVRVFDGMFGEAGQSDFTDDPGFNASSNSLPNDVLLGFSFADALRVWDPVGENFDATAPTTITMEKFGALATTPTIAGTTAPGFLIATTGSSGGLHSHAAYYLDPPLTPGVYMLTLQLDLQSPSLTDPEPIYVVLGYQVTEAEVEAAASWQAAAIAPPACPGDVTADGSTDVSDFFILASNFGTPSGADRAAGDLTDDGAVDVSDFFILASDFGCPN